MSIELKYTNNEEAEKVVNKLNYILNNNYNDLSKVIRKLDSWKNSNSPIKDEKIKQYKQEEKRINKEIKKLEKNIMKKINNNI